MVFQGLGTDDNGAWLCGTCCAQWQIGSSVFLYNVWTAVVVGCGSCEGEAVTILCLVGRESR